MAIIDKIVEKAKEDGYLRFASNRPIAVQEDAKEAYSDWCRAQGRPFVAVIDLRGRFAEVSLGMLETVPRDLFSGDASKKYARINHKYYRRQKKLIEKWAANWRQTKSEKGLPFVLWFGWIGPGATWCRRILKPDAARVARAFLKIGTDWTAELARQSSPDAGEKIIDSVSPSGRTPRPAVSPGVADAARA